MRKIIIFFALMATVSSCHNNTQTTTENGAKKYETETLQGTKVSADFAYYLGVKEGTILPKEVSIDFEKNLQELWQKKIDFASRHSYNSADILQLGKKLVAEYKNGPKTSVSIQEYVAHINEVLKKLKENIDWSTVQNFMHMEKSDIVIVKDIANSFDGFDLIAYAMTELMPSEDGKLNKDFLDFLLKNAGEEYVEMIPAIYDCQISFGPYQMTPLALSVEEFGPLDTHAIGASIINTAVLNSPVPDEVKLLRGDNHHRAAFLFMIFNMCNLVKAKNLNLAQKNLLRTSWSQHKDDLVLYCAAAHHNPRDARNAAINWINHGFKNKFEIRKGAKVKPLLRTKNGNKQKTLKPKLTIVRDASPFETFCDASTIHLYVIKTYRNLHALR